MEEFFFPSPARDAGIKTRHSGSLEKLIEPEGEIKFFKLCGIAELKNLTLCDCGSLPAMTSL